MLESKNANKEAAMSTGRYPVVLFMRSPLSPPARGMHPPIWNRQDRTIWLTARLRLFLDALADRPRLLSAGRPATTTI